MKITRRGWVAIAAAPLAGALVAGCNPVSFNVHANGTVSPVHKSRSASAPAAASSAPVASPADTVTVTAPPTPTPTQTASTSAVVTPAQVEQCLAPVPGSTPRPQSMLQLESAQAWGNLDGCLQVPTAEFNQFAGYVATLVVQAAADGQLADAHHCRNWVDGTLTPVVQRYDRAGSQ